MNSVSAPPPAATPAASTRSILGHGWEIEGKTPGDLRLVTVDTAPFRGAKLTFRKSDTEKSLRLLKPIEAAKGRSVAVSVRAIVGKPGFLQSVFLLSDIAGRRTRYGPLMEIGSGQTGDAHSVAGFLDVKPPELGPDDRLYLCMELSPDRGFLAVQEIASGSERASGEIKAQNDRKSWLEQAVDRLNGAMPSPYYQGLKVIIQGATSPTALVELERLIDADLRRRGLQLTLQGPLVSVILPVLDRVGIVREAIDSVLAQSYRRFELIVCDDGSTDGSKEVIASMRDPRLRLIAHAERKGAGAARNSALAQATGKYIAYIDSDNLWHPLYLEAGVAALETNAGRIACTAPFFDLDLRGERPVLRPRAGSPFQLEEQIARPSVDLNSFIHRADVMPALGRFDERLERRQDYDLVARYTWLRDPIEIDLSFNIYRRIAGIGQITIDKKENTESPALIAKKIDRYRRSGLPAEFPAWVNKVTVVSWDMSRNHFAKAYSLAEALSRRVQVELISFRFFEEEIFSPLADEKPPFETKYFRGCDFPEFFDEFARALGAVTGDIIYAVKPRLPSLGLALMDNFHRGTPIMVEVNDLETIVSSPGKGDLHATRPLQELGQNSGRAHSPHDLVWSQVLDPLVTELPVVFTHNGNLDRHYGGRCLYMRNMKNETAFSPERFDRDLLRAELGFAPSDRILLFGGLVRRHKGIYELLALLERLDDPRYKLLFVGSRETPDLRDLMKLDRGRAVKFMPPQSPENMAKINLASDLVLLWLDPAVPASHFQMPYKLSDALAMGPAIIASPLSDLPGLEDAGALWTVPFGDFDALVERVRFIFDNPEERARRRDRARAIFEREFTYGAAIANFAIAAHRLPATKSTYDVSIRFANAFAAFRNQAERRTP